MHKDEEVSAPHEKDYEVGYARPPKATRFQAGRSGNPRGRPRGVKNFATLFTEELARSVTLTENGRRRRMAKREALIKQTINKALSNDPKAAALVFDQIRRLDSEPAGAPASDLLKRQDEPVVASILARLRMSADLAVRELGDDALESGSE